MSIPVAVVDLEDDGVRLVSPQHSGFDLIAGPLIGRHADRLLGLKPLLVVIANDTPKTVAAASVIFRVARPVGGLVAWTNTTFPDVVIGALGSSERPGVRPNESTVVARSAVIEGFGHQGPEDWLQDVIDELVRQRDEELADARTVTIELDAVIFDDGTLVGPDEDGKLASLFTGRVAAYQHWLRIVADGLAAGQSVELACSPILKFQDEVQAQRGSLRGVPADNIQAEVEKTNAAADVVRWRRRVGDADLPGMLAGLRLSPFDVHR